MDLNAILVIRAFDRVILCFVLQQSKSGSGRLTVEVSVAHTITHIHTHTPSRTSLNGGSARRRGRYLHNKYKRRTSMPTAGLEPAIPAMERPQTYNLDAQPPGPDNMTK